MLLSENLAAPSETAPESVAKRPDNIPPATWEALSEAGHVAAERLLDLLQSKSFERLKSGDQARLIELALNRAFGPPIKREMSLTLSGTVSDAVAESLSNLASVDLPEMAAHGRKPHKMGRDT